MIFFIEKTFSSSAVASSDRFSGGIFVAVRKNVTLFSFVVESLFLIFKFSMYFDLPIFIA